MNSITSWIKERPKTTIFLTILFVASSVILVVKLKSKPLEKVSISRGDLSTSIYGSAQLKTNKSFDLKLGTSARILEIKKTIGTRVNKGDVLVTFENLPNFHSPIDGVITALNFKNGETAFSQSTVLSIVDAKDLYLEMSFDQKSIRFVKSGQSARISFDGYRDLKINGTVRSTFSNNGLFFGIIDITDGDPSFLPGMSADVAIITETRKDVLLAPLGAIKDEKILIDRNGIQEEISVATGNDDGKLVEIQNSNLRVGDLAIIRTSLPQQSKPKSEGP